MDHLLYSVQTNNRPSPIGDSLPDPLNAYANHREKSLIFSEVRSTEISKTTGSKVYKHLVVSRELQTILTSLICS